MHGETCVGNGFRATAIDDGVEVVCGKIETLLTYLSMRDVTQLHTAFTDGLYRNHSSYSLLQPR